MRLPPSSDIFCHDVQAEATDEPLKLNHVEVGQDVVQSLGQCWRRQKGRSLYKTEAEFVELVKQV